MDGGGEAIQAKRRGLATLISHLTPMLWRAGGRADLEKLHQSFHALMDKADDLSPALVAEYERVTRAEVTRLGLDRQLGLDVNGDWRRMAPALHRFLHDIEDAPLPAGLPVFGQSPGEDQLRDAVGAYLFAAFPRAMHDDVEARIPVWAAAFAAWRGSRPGWLERERSSRSWPGSNAICRAGFSCCATAARRRWPDC